MAAALDAGAASSTTSRRSAHDPAAAPLVAARGCPVVLMHMRGDAGHDVCAGALRRCRGDVTRELGRADRSRRARRHRREQHRHRPRHRLRQDRRAVVELLRRLPELARARLPDPGRRLPQVLHRRGLTGEADPRRRLPGSLAAGLFALRGRRDPAGARCRRKPCRRCVSGRLLTARVTESCFHCQRRRRYMRHVVDFR